MVFPTKIKDPFVQESVTFFIYYGIICYFVYTPILVTEYFEGFNGYILLIRFINIVSWVVPP